MDEHDAAAAGRLLANATLHFKAQPTLTGIDAITAFYASALGEPGNTRHLISNLLVRGNGRQIAYSAVYQRWSLTDTVPVCEAIGEYRGTFTTTPTGLKWSEHRIIHPIHPQFSQRP